MADAVTHSQTDPLPASTRLAIDRTRLAYERTLMAWVRTAASLISFGFTIYKFFQYLREDPNYVAAGGALSPRNFGLLLIGIGLSALVLATLDHVRHMRHLRREYGDVPYSLASAVGILVGLLGIVGLVGVFLRV